jgi:ABC-type sugar transport system ATPase subunit
VLSGIGNDDDVVEPGGITKGMVRQNPHLYPHIKVG